MIWGLFSNSTGRLVPVPEILMSGSLLGIMDKEFINLIEEQALRPT